MNARPSFDFITLSPAGTPEAALAIAGSRAGALGVLNLEFARDPDTIARELTRLTQHTPGGRIGVLVDGASESQLSTVLENSSASRLEAVLLALSPAAPCDPRELAALAKTARGEHRQVYAVVSTLEHASVAKAAGIDAIIAKGNEAGGWVGEETTFVLLQRLLADTSLGLPISAFGGVGLHTAAACQVVGLAGAVLDSQLLLARESPLPQAWAARIAAMDGTEAVCLGASIGAPFRVYARRGVHVSNQLLSMETELELLDMTAEQRLEAWRTSIRDCVEWRNAEAAVLAIGQDAAFAAPLAERGHTVAGILDAIRQAIDEHTSLARVHRPLQQGSAFAEAHGTRYPIVQGPMTRVSDRAEFAASVAEAGALPFLALALMRAPEVRTLLEEMRHKLGGRPWGVGILGFVPPELRAEQIAVIREFKPPFALIAGGRPAQARELDEHGTPTYLHVPSPGLLKLFLEEGATRFVFEGRECGGHVGPRSSFVLWEAMLQMLLEYVPSGDAARRYHVVFAGGIHDDVSAAMVAALAAPLVERGCRIGVLLGSAYLFSEEAVTTGAITAEFQRAALACDGTVLLESGPGQATRCAPSPFAQEFGREKRRLVGLGLSPEELRKELELLNVGRLRIASKGLDHNPRYDADPAELRLVSVNEQEQRRRGLYMIGQVAALRDRTCSLAELHAQVSAGGTARLQAHAWPEVAAVDVAPAPPPSKIAIVGVGCILPGASDARTFWNNINNKVDAITEVPADRWDWHLYYDADRFARDKVYSRWGGFVDAVAFDALQFGMPPNSLRSIEPFQLLGLLVVRAALEDAGYLDRPFPRERTSVMLGAGGGGGDLASGYLVRSSLPGLFGASATELTESLNGVLPEWTEDSFAGLLMNVAAGRAANRFDLGGLNFTVDAACASSLAAVYLAVRDLELRTSDVAIAGGVDAIENPFAFLCFSKTQALSPTGRCRPFDASADGIAISEGFAAIVLKRLEDAERDGDRIYAVIQGVGGSSDGRDRGLTAPRPEGQIRALRRAYAQAGFSPATVGLIEAHGTGTVVGDQTEVQSLTQFFGEAGAERQKTALGSVKSMIGHAKASAGIAGLVKVALALHHKVLPPTLGVSQPNPKANFPDTPFYVNTENRPWMRSSSGAPRRAGVQAFGFGGTNFHLALEEYTGAYLPEPGSALAEWGAEVFVWRGGTRAELSATISSLAAKLDAGAAPRLADLAYTVDAHASEASPEATAALAVVAESLPDLREKLTLAENVLAAEGQRAHQSKGVHFAERGFVRDGGRTAYLFPGQGSQYVNMARQLATLFPSVRACFERADEAVAGDAEPALSWRMFPPPTFDPEDARRQHHALTQTDVAQPALGATSLAYLRLLESLGLEPDMVGGHSFGEFTALHAAGCFDATTLLQLAQARGRFIREGMVNGESGAMAAVEAGPDELLPLLNESEVVLANLNTPRQTVISGTRAAIEEVTRRCVTAGLHAQELPVACAFHSPLVKPAQQRLAQFLRSIRVHSPRLPVYSNTTAEPYPCEPAAIVQRLTDHLVQPVNFVGEIRAMYDAGARIFVEVGPRSVLSNLVGGILGAEHPQVRVALDAGPGRDGLQSFLQGVAALVSEGAAVRVQALFDGRDVRRLDLEHLELETGERHYSSATWLVDGHKARPAHQPVSVPKPLQVAVVDPSHANHARPSSTVPSAGATIDTPNVRPADEQSSNSGHVASTSAPVAPLKEAVRMIESESGPASLHPDTSEVMHQFQGVMQRFLETQTKVMLAYLGAEDTAAAPGTPRGSMPLRRAYEPRGAASLPQAGTPGLSPAEALAPPATNGAAAGTPPVPAAAHQNGRASGTASTAVDRKRLEERLLAVVSERTGYPPEMLDQNADLEADLGIDSIKRVEIAGTLVHSLPPELSDALDLEQLTRCRTLAAVIATLEQLMVGSGLDAAKADGGADLRPFDRAPADERIDRYTLAAVPAPPAPTTAKLGGTGVVVVVDDGIGVAPCLSELLQQQGHRVVRLRHHGAPETEARAALTCDFSDADSLRETVVALHQQFGPAKAVVHLGALRRRAGDHVGLDPDAWRALWERDVRGLFLLLQALQSDLERVAASDGAVVMAATALGGAFGVGDISVEFAGDAGIPGLLKTLALESPTIRVKAVDVPTGPEAAIAQWLVTEMMADDGLVEVGYRGGQRTMLQLVPSPLDTDLGPEVPLLDSSSVVLLTGGARGITAEVAASLARNHRPILLLIGRTSLPVEVEPVDTATLEDPLALRRAIGERLRRTDPNVTVRQIEAEYRRLQAVREIRGTLARLSSSGARAHYFSCDVRDPSAVATLIDEIYRTFGRIDGVVHGAGVVEDKLVRDKRLDSFDRVVQTKVDGALALAAALRPEKLHFLVFFSSVAARFGNAGQSDYAAANEVLNKLAQQLNQQWPARVVAINWGPWLTTGMVSPEVQRQFASRGVTFIPPAVGCRILQQELELGGNSDTEVVIGGMRPHHKSSEGKLPLLMVNSNLTRTAEDRVEVVRRFDPNTDVYLRDHQIDGRPVLPFAMALELMAEVAVAGWPAHEVVELAQMRLLRGIAIPGDGMNLRIVAQALTERESDARGLPTGVRVDVSIFTDGEWHRPHYQAQIRLAPESPPDTDALMPPDLEGELHPLALELVDAYREWLFHGPLLQHIAKVDAIGPSGAHASLRPSTPGACVVGASDGEWLIDPVVLDSALQVNVLWARQHWETTILPSFLASYRRVGALNRPHQSTIRHELRIQPGTRAPLVCADHYFLDADRRVIGVMRGMEGTGSLALNRLAEATTR